MVIGFYFGSRTSTQAAAAVGGATAESPPDGPQATRAKKLASAADAAADAAEVASKRAQAAIDRIQAAMSTEKNALKKKLLMTERGTAGDRQAAAQKAAVSARNAAKEADVAAEKAVADDPAPLLSSFMSRICSGYGPVGTGL
jgi:hypothetical protein